MKRLVRLPKLEELRFPHYTTTKAESGHVRTTKRGFRALSRAASLRSVQYTPPANGDTEMPSLATITALFHFTNFVRITLSALWLPEMMCAVLLTEHRFEHLRCLELIGQDNSGDCICLHTDADLLPLVKPAH